MAKTSSPKLLAASSGLSVSATVALDAFVKWGIIPVVFSPRLQADSAQQLDASGLAGLQEALELLGLAKLPAEAGVVTQAFRKVSLAVHPDRKEGIRPCLRSLSLPKSLWQRQASQTRTHSLFSCLGARRDSLSERPGSWYC